MQFNLLYYISHYSGLKYIWKIVSTANPLTQLGSSCSQTSFTNLCSLAATGFTNQYYALVVLDQVHELSVVVPHW